MRHSDGAASDSQPVITQAEADSCCASSEREESSQSSSPFAAAISSAVLGIATPLPITVPTLVRTDAWRTAAPAPVAPIPKHVLLSVFLV